MDSMVKIKIEKEEDSTKGKFRIFFIIFELIFICCVFNQFIILSFSCNHQRKKVETTKRLVSK